MHTEIAPVLPGPTSGTQSSLAFNATLNQSAVVQAAYTRRSDDGGVAIVAAVDLPPGAFLASATPGAADGSEVMMIEITVTVRVKVPVRVGAVPGATSAGAGATVASKGECCPAPRAWAPMLTAWST